MTKRRMYQMLTFILSTFILLAIVIVYEVNSQTKKNRHPVTEDNLVVEAPIVEDTVGVSIIPEVGETDYGAGDKTDKDEVESITKETMENTELIDEDKTIRLTFVGDVYFSKHVLGQYDAHGLNGIVTEEVREQLMLADVTMINQEFPFGTTGSAMEDKQYTFRVDPKYISIYDELDIDMVTLANNHTLDFGVDTLHENIQVLKDNKIPYVGAGSNLEEAKETKYIEIKGKRIAFLGASRVIPVAEWTANKYNPGLFTTYDPTLLNQEIAIAKKSSDLVVVYVHWGIERKSYPEEYQRKLAQGYIDHGADIIVGSHPHVLQGIEYYKGKPIVYSLGNFIFNNSIEETAILHADIMEDNSLELRIVPGFAQGAKTQLYPMDKLEGFYKRFEELSFSLAVEEGVIVPK